MDPVADILAARARARQQRDPYADVCFIATVGSTGEPQVRAVVLRDIDARGVALVLNARSPKWQQLEDGGKWALHLLWLTVQRQYRIYGRLDPMEPERLQQYWQRKGHASRLLEHYYDAFEAQSQPIPSRAHLLQGMKALRQRYPEPDAVPIPDSLRGVYVYPTAVEVWHGSPEDRLHERHWCTRTAAGWSSHLLVP